MVGALRETEREAENLRAVLRCYRKTAHPSIFTQSLAVHFIVDYSALLNIGLAVFMLTFMVLSKLVVMIVKNLSPQTQYKFFSNPYMFYMILLLIVWVTPFSGVISAVASGVYSFFHSIVYFIG